ncbi:MAG TPA: hypothetical protein VGL89_15445 [Candidatus Koribacter sp.]|jgi:hypothetical protein
MKRATRAVATIVFFVLAALPAFSQGIQSSVINLPLNGNWRQAPDIEQDTPSGVQVFYDQNTGTVLQIRSDFKIREVGEISAAFRLAGQSPATPDAAKILMMTMFPLPSAYQKAVVEKIHEGHAPKLWEVREPGNAQWFYISQLFAGFRASGAGRESEIREEYIPLRVTRAEHRSAGRGDALLFEAETEKAAPESVVRHFKLPGTVKDQRLRYGWIQFSPAGIGGSENVVSVAFATPVSSGFDVNNVLETMVKNYGVKAADAH